MYTKIVLIMIASLLSVQPAFAGDVVTTKEELANIQSRECAALYPTDAVKYSACMKGKTPEPGEGNEDK